MSIPRRIAALLLALIFILLSACTPSAPAPSDTPSVEPENVPSAPVTPPFLDTIDQGQSPSPTDSAEDAALAALESALLDPELTLELEDGEPIPPLDPESFLWLDPCRILLARDTGGSEYILRTRTEDEVLAMVNTLSSFLLDVRAACVSNDFIDRTMTALARGDTSTLPDGFASGSGDEGRWFRVENRSDSRFTKGDLRQTWYPDAKLLVVNISAFDTDDASLYHPGPDGYEDSSLYIHTDTGAAELRTDYSPYVRTFDRSILVCSVTELLSRIDESIERVSIISYRPSAESWPDLPYDEYLLWKPFSHEDTFAEQNAEWLFSVITDYGYLPEDVTAENLTFRFAGVTDNMDSVLYLEYTDRAFPKMLFFIDGERESMHGLYHFPTLAAIDYGDGWELPGE